MEDEIEIKELPHKDFGKSGKEWGTQAQKMMEKMGWKRGLGLGPRNQGVVNPVIPSGKYDGAGKRRGLGSLETAPDQKAKKAKSGDILQLPSYLRKRKKSPSLDPFIVGEILTKYKMSKSDLAIGKQSDHQYGYLNKTETCSINEQIERVCKLGRERLKAAPDLLQIGIHIHKKAREEEIGSDLHLYKQEASRLWRFIASKSAFSPFDVYSSFLDALPSELVKPSGSKSGSKTGSKSAPSAVIELDSDCEIVEVIQLD